MFPFSIKYSKNLPGYADPETDFLIINHIREYLLGRKGNVISASPDEVVFEGSSERFTSNWNIFKMVGRGRFNLLGTPDKKLLIYEIYLDKSLFVIAGIAGIPAFLTGGFWGAVLLVLWLAGMNLVTAFFSHQNMFDKVAGDVDKVLVERRILTQTGFQEQEASDKTMLLITSIAIAVILIFAVIACLAL